MTRLGLLGLHSVDNAENEDENDNDDENNHNNPDPKIETALLNEGESELAAVRTSDVSTSDSVGEARDLVVSTVDSAGRSLKGNTSRELRGNGTGIFSTTDSGSVAEVGLLGNSDELSAVIDAVDGHGGTVVLDVGQLASSAHGLVSALVVLVAVLVGVLSLHSTTEAIISRLAGSLESLGEHAQLSELEAVATAVRAIRCRIGGDLTVGTLRHNHSVLVEDSCVVEVVGTLNAVLLESILGNLVEDGPATTIVSSLESPRAGSSDVASGTSDDGVGGDELSSVVVVGPSGSSADATRTTGVNCALDVIEQLGDGLIDSKIARRLTIQESEASIGSELDGAIEVYDVGDSRVEDVDLKANDVGTYNEVAVLDSNRGTHIHDLVALHETLGIVADSTSSRHVVSVDFLTVDVDNDTVGGLDGEGKSSVAAEISDSEGLSEVGSGSSKVAESAGLGLLPSGGGTALRLGPVGRSRGTAVQVLVGSVERSDEVTDIEVEVFGSLIFTEGTVKDNRLISKEDSEVANIPAIATAISKSESVATSGSALRVVVGLSISESVLCEKRVSIAVLQLEAHFLTSVTGLDENGELVVGIETFNNRKSDNNGSGLTLGVLGGDGVLSGRH